VTCMFAMPHIEYRRGEEQPFHHVVLHLANRQSVVQPTLFSVAPLLCVDPNLHNTAYDEYSECIFYTQPAMLVGRSLFQQHIAWRDGVLSGATAYVHPPKPIDLYIQLRGEWTRAGGFIPLVVDHPHGLEFDTTVALIGLLNALALWREL
jgi:hypothetical protein